MGREKILNPESDPETLAAIEWHVNAQNVALATYSSIILELKDVLAATIENSEMQHGGSSESGSLRHAVFITSQRFASDVYSLLEVPLWSVQNATIFTSAGDNDIVLVDSFIPRRKYVEPSSQIMASLQSTLDQYLAPIEDDRIEILGAEYQDVKSVIDSQSLRLCFLHYSLDSLPTETVEVFTEHYVAAVRMSLPLENLGEIIEVSLLPDLVRPEVQGSATLQGSLVFGHSSTSVLILIFSAGLAATLHCAVMWKCLAGTIERIGSRFGVQKFEGIQLLRKGKVGDNHSVI